MAFNQTAQTLRSPGFIWRTPEIMPPTWEEQRVFDRSSQGFWMFPSTGNE
jgi:hypothetical protein